MKTVQKIACLAPILALALAGAAQASESSARASVDLMIDDDTNTTGGTAQASMTSGASSATASADLISIRAMGDDNNGHFSPGRPDASGQSDFAFEVQGTTGVIALTFNFVVDSSFAFPVDNYTADGLFSALLRSSSDVSPYVLGEFSIVQASCCGGRFEQGSIQTYPDYFVPGSFSSVGWAGGPVANFSLTTTFVAGVSDAGRLGLAARGAGGSVDFDIGIRLASITTDSQVQGLSIYDDDTGARFQITSAAPTGVPEPAAWAMMILGFGMAGALFRRNATTGRFQTA